MQTCSSVRQSLCITHSSCVQGSHKSHGHRQCGQSPHGWLLCSCSPGRILRPSRGRPVCPLKTQLLCVHVCMRMLPACCTSPQPLRASGLPGPVCDSGTSSGEPDLPLAAADSPCQAPCWLCSCRCCRGFEACPAQSGQQAVQGSDSRAVRPGRCIYDAKPRQLTADEAALLANMAELVVRCMEQHVLLSRRSQVMAAQSKCEAHVPLTEQPHKLAAAPTAVLARTQAMDQAQPHSCTANSQLVSSEVLLGCDEGTLHGTDTACLVLPSLTSCLAPGRLEVDPTGKARADCVTPSQFKAHACAVDRPGPMS